MLIPPLAPFVMQKYPFLNAHRIVGSRKRRNAVKFRDAEKSILGHPVFAYEHGLYLCLAPSVKSLMVESVLVVTVLAGLKIRDVAYNNAVRRYLYIAVVADGYSQLAVIHRITPPLAARKPGVPSSESFPIASSLSASAKSPNLMFNVFYLFYPFGCLEPSKCFQSFRSLHVLNIRGGGITPPFIRRSICLTTSLYFRRRSLGVGAYIISWTARL